MLKHEISQSSGESTVDRPCGDQSTDRIEDSTSAENPPKIMGPGPATIGLQEFQTLYEENLSLIYRYIYSKVGNREEAEDLTSQVFIKAVRRVDPRKGSQSMQKWLFQVTRTTIADYWRVHYRIATSSLDALLEAGWEGPSEQGPDTISSSPADHVHRILATLPERYREVLTCRFLHNLSIRDTAAKMGLNEANVKVLQFRALKRAADLEDGILKTTI